MEARIEGDDWIRALGPRIKDVYWRLGLELKIEGDDWMRALGVGGKDSTQGCEVRIQNKGLRYRFQANTECEDWRPWMGLSTLMYLGTCTYKYIPENELEYCNKVLYRSTLVNILKYLFLFFHKYFYI